MTTLFVKYLGNKKEYDSFLDRYSVYKVLEVEFNFDGTWYLLEKGEGERCRFLSSYFRKVPPEFVVKCINNDGCVGVLTKHKLYEYVKTEVSDCIKIVDGDDYLATIFNENRFEKVIEDPEKEKKLTQIQDLPEKRRINPVQKPKFKLGQSVYIKEEGSSSTVYSICNSCDGFEYRLDGFTGAFFENELESDEYKGVLDEVFSPYSSMTDALSYFSQCNTRFIEDFTARFKTEDEMEETIMTTPIKVEGRTFINNVDVEKVTEDQIHTWIQDSQDRIESLEKLQVAAKSERIASQIKAIQDGIEAAVAILDSHFDD